MKIVNVEQAISYLVETGSGSGGYTQFRREGPDNWSKLMGLSWVPVCCEERVEELERLFTEYLERVD